MLEILLIIVLMLMFVSGVCIRDPLAPPCIYCAMFAFALAWAIYGQDGWGFSMSFEAFGIILTGTLAFATASLLLTDYFRFRGSMGVTVSQRTPFGLSEISVSKVVAVCLFVIHLLVAIYYILTLLRITGVSNLFDLPSTYRNSYMSGSVSLPFFARLCMNLMRGASVAISCTICNNLLLKKFRKNHGLLLSACLAIYVLLTLASGERTSTVRMLAVFFMSFAVLWKRQYPNRRLLTLKRATGFVACAVVSLYGFSAVRYVVGRSSTLNLFDYIAFYVGAPIYNLDHFLTTSTTPSLTGELTFLGTYNNLARLGFGVVRTVSRDGITIPEKGLYMGNVYTSYYDYLSDFGIMGLIVLVVLYAFIINALYQYAKCGSTSYFIGVSCYSFFGTTLFFAAFTEQFFSTYFTISTIEMLLIIVLFDSFLNKRKKPLKIRKLV